jgi:hypothetical protein
MDRVYRLGQGLCLLEMFLFSPSSLVGTSQWTSLSVSCLTRTSEGFSLAKMIREGKQEGVSNEPFLELLEG